MERPREKWAKEEVELACKRATIDSENKAFYEDSTCYKAALIAYEGLMRSCYCTSAIDTTKKILIRLMDNLPITPIMEEDFGREGTIPSDGTILSVVPCKRYPSLLKITYVNGYVKYSDRGRVQYTDFTGHDNLALDNDSVIDAIDKIDPISLPYLPSMNKYMVVTFVTNTGNMVTGVITYRNYFCLHSPNGEKMLLNLYEKEFKGERFKITEEEYRTAIIKDQFYDRHD